MKGYGISSRVYESLAHGAYIASEVLGFMVVSGSILIPEKIESFISNMGKVAWNVTVKVIETRRDSKGEMERDLAEFMENVFK